MRKVISFDKKLEFKTMIGEVTSISLDPNLKFSDDNDITGELVISGKYKLTAASRLEEDFLFSLPLVSPSENIILVLVLPEQVTLPLCGFFLLFLQTL